MTNQDDRAEFEERLTMLRPALHRYAARMMGSALDGEDVVQEAIARAIAGFGRAAPETSLDGWLFRITHNAAIDQLRARARHRSERLVEDGDIVSPGDEAASRLAARAALSVFMRLPASQRAAVILKDVLGYSNEEAAGILGSTLAATKALLHRGRERLRLFADEPAATPLDAAEMQRLQTYIDRFNARDFDALRAMLADDVRFELIAKAQGGRSAFETYFTRYAGRTTWHLALGTIDGRLAAIVTDPAHAFGASRYVITVDWADGRIVRMPDFYYAAYVTDGAAIRLAPFPPGAIMA